MFRSSHWFRSARWIGAVVAVLALVLVAPSAQKRVAKKGPADFKALHAASGASHEAGHYATCLKQLREMTAVVAQKFEEKVLASMPPAPAEYEKVVKKKQGTNQMEAAMLASMAAVGRVIEQRYKSLDHKVRDAVISVTSGSPLLQMFGMWVANPAMLGPDAELIEYEQCKAVLQKEGNDQVLRIKLADDLIEVRAPGRDGDFLLALMSQQHLNALQASLEQ